MYDNYTNHHIKRRAQQVQRENCKNEEEEKRAVRESVLTVPQFQELRILLGDPPCDTMGRRIKDSA